MKEIREIGLTGEDLVNIGNNIAQFWDAKCCSYKVDHKMKIVFFNCDENGEKFSTHIPFMLLSEYKSKR